MISASEKLKGHLAAATAVIIWGSTFVSTKVLLRDFSPVEILLVRFLIGYFVLWMICPKRLKLQSIRTEILFLIAGFTGIFGNYLFENLALTSIQASDLSVIVSLAPFFVAVFARIVFKQRLTPLFFPGFICAMIGIVLICFQNGGHMSFHFWGDLCGVLVAIVWAVYSICMEKLDKLQINSVLMTRRIFFYGLLFIILLSAVQGVNFTGSQLGKAVNLANFLYLGIVACALSFLIWAYSTARIGAVSTNLYFYVQPAVTILFSMVILQERMTWRGWLGTALTFGGLLISQQSEKH